MRQAIATVPEMHLNSEPLTNRVKELQSYHAIYSLLFHRLEQRQGAHDYLNGLLINIPSKFIKPMALLLKNLNPMPCGQCLGKDKG